ncbi:MULTISPECIES: ROK family transcriptional regulator [unclassified Caulobacter]|uniref:ROK family transcriptional regulator n=1 Tax=unclassified Caulobacter TaxID=2648921 RepID=UPI0006F3851D|nr:MULTISPECIES: ROK family transcriptional regulator [unclassified Caulobacter]KQV62201.1 ROK family transcriptional regulator [Caulobacter sp. Root342]KQV63121.1 ROK family transcriptional regulator [Caulobacter sp. Root343]
MPHATGRHSRDTQNDRASLSGTNIERAGDYNQRVALQSIRVGLAKTKLEVAAYTGLTVPAVTNITNRLLEDGLIVQAGKLHGNRGQPAMTFAVNPDGCYSIGLNIDRDHVTIVLLDLAGRVRARATRDVAFLGPADVAAFFDQHCKTFHKLRGVAADRIVGVGVALPDDLAKADLPHRPAAYDAWNAVDVRALLSRSHDWPVMLENDAAAAALGELHFGHGMRASSFFYMLISSGLGGGLVIDGEYFRGAHGRSGELGFLPVSPDGATTLEDFVSLSALNEHLGALAPADPADLAGLPPQGRARIDAWLDVAAERLCDPLVSISCLIDPQAVFIGGRLPEALIDRLAEAVNAKLADRRLALTMARARRAALSADAPAMGAAILPIIARHLPSRSALWKTDQV